MSYLSDWKAGKLTPIGFFKKSAGWLARKAGLSDDKVDDLVAKADKATDEAVLAVEVTVAGLIATAFPALPEEARKVIAHRAAVAALETVDVAVSAAGSVIKANN